MDKICVCAVVGPTASGKTAFAASLAKCFSGEVVSFDSMQVYREAPIATAMPTPEEMLGVPHHLLSFLSCDDNFSVASYTQMADKVIADIHSRGCLPVLVGGTGLYYSSLIDHISFGEQNEEESKRVRELLKLRLQEEGIDPLYRELQKIDPSAAEKIHPNNHTRVLRALEVYYTRGMTISQQNELSKAEPSPYVPCVFGLDYKDRSLLYDRINRRVDLMLEQGLLDEIRSLAEKNPDGTLLQAIGIKEFLPFLRGECTLEKAVDTVKKESRHYAKRQLTWFRRDDRVQWLYRDDYNDFDSLLCQAQSMLSAFLKEKQ